jgi:short-subunit dehydrogenase
VSERVLLIGATSGIGRALCDQMARRGCELIIAGRDEDEASRVASDLFVRYGRQIHAERFEATAWEEHEAFFDRCLEHFDGDLDGVVLCVGYLPDQPETQLDFEEAFRTVTVNFVSALSILNRVANYMESRGSGYIVAISSVAGDRGRQSNYTYGSCKAALSVYLQGLRNRLFHAGVHVLTVKPGFVDTAMTYGIINANSPLVARPEQVSADIERAIRKRKNVLYTRWFWRPIMLVIRAIPESIFKRLRL